MLLFYGEYGAYADKKYMVNYGDWSRIIESTHALFCGLFVSYALIYKLDRYITKYYILISVAMGSQLMNSILYMLNYFNELICNPNVGPNDNLI